MRAYNESNCGIRSQNACALRADFLCILKMGVDRFDVQYITIPQSNAFSKKVENHTHAVALHVKFHNFSRVHKTLRVTPAMPAGITDHIWSLEEIAGFTH